MNLIVLACGNVLRGDDGIAPYLAHQLYGLLGDSDTTIICCQQWLPEQAEDLSNAERAVFIDASATIAAGEIEVRSVRAASGAATVTSHTLSPDRLMRLARELFGKAPERAFLVTIGGGSFEHGNELSEPVRAAIPAALNRIQAL
jgi:hydrogenase maturation protease